MPVNPAAALAIQLAKGILSMGWAFWSVDHVKQSHFGGPPPVAIKMSWPGVVNCQPEGGQFESDWDGPASPESVSLFVHGGMTDAQSGYVMASRHRESCYLVTPLDDAGERLTKLVRDFG